MVLHDFLSKRLAPLQDRSHRPAWMYTGVKDIMRLDRGPGCSLGDTLLATSLKALTTDPPSAELVMPAAGCEPLCVNQLMRTALLAIMPTLDDVDIAPIQWGDPSHGVVIPRPGGPGGAAGGSNTVALGKGKQTCVILNDDEVSSDKDEPPQKRLRQLSGARPAVRDEATTDDKEATVKWAMEEAAVKRATEEVVVKKAAEETAAVKAAATKATGVAGGSLAPSKAPPAAGARRFAAPSGSTPLDKRPYRCVWKPRFV
jgi:hypothetical protein